MGIKQQLIRAATRGTRHYLVGGEQQWEFASPGQSWAPPRLGAMALYLHVPFCRHFCPYCPYTKIPYNKELEGGYTKAALAEVDWWASNTNAKATSLYIGGGTPTLALKSVAFIVDRIRERLHLTGEVCIETNPADVDREIVKQLHDMGVNLVSLGVQSFRDNNLAIIGRDYSPIIARKALALLTNSNFTSVNVDLMFALPGESRADVIYDMACASLLGANQLTFYPLFTFPYTSVGNHLKSGMVRMPDLKTRYTQYRTISDWCADKGYKRVSVWGFKQGDAPRYSSVTRDSYIGIGPGSGSLLPDGFTFNTFDYRNWQMTASEGKMPVALYMEFKRNMAGWWWLYWRFYDTCIPMFEINTRLCEDAPKVRHWLKAIEK